MQEQIRPKFTQEKPLKILVSTPSYTHRSAGIRLTHYLVHLINLLGHEGYAYNYGDSTWRNNPEWQCRLWAREQVDFTVLPEVHNIRINSSPVVRWCLNGPGVLGGPKTFPPEEIVFYHGDEFRELTRKSTSNSVYKFFLPNIDPELYKEEVPKDLEGSYWVGKGNKTIELPEEEKLTLITRACPENKKDLIRLLKRSKKFYSFDSLSTINQEAVLCGCEAYIVTDKITPYSVKMDKFFMDEEKDLKRVEKFIEQVCRRLSSSHTT